MPPWLFCCTAIDLGAITEDFLVFNNALLWSFVCREYTEKEKHHH